MRCNVEIILSIVPAPEQTIFISSHFCRFICVADQFYLLVYFLVINVTFIWINLVVAQYQINIFTRVNRV